MKQPEYRPGITPFQDKDYVNFFPFKLGLYPFYFIVGLKKGLKSVAFTESGLHKGFWLALVLTVVSFQLLPFEILDISSLCWKENSPTLTPVTRKITAHTFQVTQLYIRKTEITNNEVEETFYLRNKTNSSGVLFKGL